MTRAQTFVGCPVCGRQVRSAKSGLVRSHRPRFSAHWDYSVYCKGEGKSPATPEQTAVLRWKAGRDKAIVTLRDCSSTVPGASAPTFDRRKLRYLSYFETPSGMQSFFVVTRTRNFVVYRAQDAWKPVPYVKACSRVEGTGPEATWLRACWEAAGDIAKPKPKAEGDR